MTRGVAYPVETRPPTRRRRYRWPSTLGGGPVGHGATSSRLAVALTGGRRPEPTGRPRASASSCRWRDLTCADHGPRGSPADRQSPIPQRAGRPRARCRPRVTGIATLKGPRVHHDMSQREPRAARPRVTGGPTCGRHGPLTDEDGRRHAPSAWVKAACVCGAGQAGARLREHLS